MTVRDRGLDIELIELKDLIGREPSKDELEGVTICPNEKRARVKRFDDSRRIIDGSGAGLNFIKFWIVLDCGEKEDRRRMKNHWESEPRPDRYTAVAVGTEQSIYDVELEERGTALPGTYATLDEAGKASAELTAISRVMES